MAASNDDPPRLSGHFERQDPAAISAKHSDGRAIQEARHTKKPATKERSGINPFTKEPIFKAKPARKFIRARPVKAAKDAVS